MTTKRKPRTDIENLTIFTDASFKDGVVGGGYWIVFGQEEHRKRIRGRVAFPKANNSSDAELMVTMKAIDIAMQDHEVKAWITNHVKNLRVVVVTDAESTYHAFDKKIPATASTLDMLKRQRFLLKVNHVKGHTNGKTPRDFVNRWCDEQATIARHELMSDGVLYTDLTKA